MYEKQLHNFHRGLLITVFLNRIEVICYEKMETFMPVTIGKNQTTFRIFGLSDDVDDGFENIDDVSDYDDEFDDDDEDDLDGDDEDDLGDEDEFEDDDEDDEDDDLDEDDDWDDGDEDEDWDNDELEVEEDE